MVKTKKGGAHCLLCELLLSDFVFFCLQHVHSSSAASLEVNSNILIYIVKLLTTTRNQTTTKQIQS